MLGRLITLHVKAMSAGSWQQAFRQIDLQEAWNASKAHLLAAAKMMGPKAAWHWRLWRLAGGCADAVCFDIGFRGFTHGKLVDASMLQHGLACQSILELLRSHISRLPMQSEPALATQKPPG